MLSDRSSTSAALAPVVADGAASADPSGGAGWLPSAAALCASSAIDATCGGGGGGGVRRDKRGKRGEICGMESGRRAVWSVVCVAVINVAVC
jgi:hypothetical protein